MMRAMTFGLSLLGLVLADCGKDTPVDSSHAALVQKDTSQAAGQVRG